jgi:lysophospholipase L1-like esterase
MVNVRRSLSFLPWIMLIAPLGCGSSGSSRSAGSGAPSVTPGGATAGNPAAQGTNPGGTTGSATGGGSTTGGGSAGGSTAGGSTAGAGGTAGSSGLASSDGGTGTGADMSAATVPCGVVNGLPLMCGEPMSCCQTWKGDAGTGTPACVTACDETQAQLCGNAADCQQTGTSTCGANGFCVDTGEVVLGNPIGDGGTAAGAGPTSAVSDGGIPAGYPMPTAANYSMCKTVPIGASGMGGGVFTGTGGGCAGAPAGNTCIECLFGGDTYDDTVDPPGTATAVSEAGNYVVTVELGGAAAAQTGIWAESSRGLLAPVTTAAGQKATYAFAVDVRSMEGQPDHMGGPGGYPGLDLFFYGPTATPPAITGIGYALATAATQPIVVYMASDSTACDQTGGVFGGWGQMLPEFFDAPIEIANYANSGASSADFIGSDLKWGAITSRWKAGDYVIIQFGHNDKTIGDPQVETNLEKYVTQAKAANVIPILVSPPARVQFGTATVDGPQTSLHAASAMGAAMAEGVAYIDLTSLSTAWYNTLGSQAAALKFHAMDSDATHTNLVGAEKLASLVANNIKDQNLPLAKYLRLEALSQ